MPNDAKVGLVIGVGLVIVIAVVFFRKDQAPTVPNSDKPTATVMNPRVALPPAPRVQNRAVAAKTAIRTAAADEKTQSRQHTVAPGDTLFSLAQRYYGDVDRFADLYRVNRERLKSPEALEAGTVLDIPEMPPEDH